MEINDFKPDKNLLKSYIVRYIIGITVGFISWAVPLLLIFIIYNLIDAFYIFLPFFIVIIVFLLFILIWLKMYYKSISYKITQNSIEWHRGVWFKTTSVVPFSKITNIDIIQGPIARHYKIGCLKIQTAGYSGQHASELFIVGVKNFKEVKQNLVDKIKFNIDLKESESKIKEKSTDQMILEEIIKIRKILEKK